VPQYINKKYDDHATIKHHDAQFPVRFGKCDEEIPQQRASYISSFKMKQVLGEKIIVEFVVDKE